jgi:hypothetical protein
MAANPRIRRLTLVPHPGSNDELRRYRLARMDDIALATPPYPTPPVNGEARVEGNGRPAKPPDGPDRRAGR